MAGVGSVLRTIRDLMRFFGGYGLFLLRGTTPAYSYAAMRRLHCQSNGYLNDGAAFLAGIAHPPKREPRPKGVLVASDDGEIHQAAESLRRDGYYVFPSLLPNDDVERLRSLATEIACTPTVAGKGSAHPGQYHAIRDSSSRFDFSSSDICQPPAGPVTPCGRQYPCARRRLSRLHAHSRPRRHVVEPAESQGDRPELGSGPAVPLRHGSAQVPEDLLLPDRCRHRERAPLPDSRLTSPEAEVRPRRWPSLRRVPARRVSRVRVRRGLRSRGDDSRRGHARLPQGEASHPR